MAFAVYRQPGSNHISLVKGQVNRYAPGAHVADGFYINVFSTNEVFYIQPDKIFTGNSFGEKAAQWQNEMYLRPGNSVKENLEEDYLHTLYEAIEAVEQNAFQKLVVSRNKKVKNADVNIPGVLDQLAAAFPECLVYIFSSPHTGTWMGATPEKLLVEKQKNIYRIMALAGTVRSEKEVKLEVWGEKEKQEQDYVAQYIASVIEQGGHTYQKSGLYNFKTGLLNHLCTDFDVTIDNKNDFLKLAMALHPTPAVAGLPKQEAIHFLKSGEKYLRECYTGYIGPVGINQNNTLFVNLRCCQLTDEAVVFYAGGGINKGSVAEKEKQEVENKILNLQRFFMR